jgi:cysteine desulfurase / selenocysteine lyase
MFNVEKIRKDFLILKRKINGHRLVYFDNAATTQKPSVILDKLRRQYARSHSNVQQGICLIAEETTQKFEAAREKVAEFIGAAKPKEIIFTRGATESINLVAYSLGRRLKKGDRILVSLSEHHSNFVPWLRLAKEKNLKLDIVKLTPGHNFDESDFKRKITKKTKLVAIAHISNVSGYIYPVEKICRLARKSGALILIDGAQSAGHIPINVQKIGCDFYAVSGHKMLAPSGIGALYGREKILEKLEPFLSGGKMISEVSDKNVFWNDLPWKFEAGTPNIEGAILFGEAIDYLNKIGAENIHKYETELMNYAFQKMKKLEFMDLLGINGIRRRIGIIPFNINGVHPHDVASALDKYGVCLRAGHHCAQPFMKHLGVSGALRVSFYIYNTKKEIDYFIAALKEIYKKFKV